MKKVITREQIKKYNQIVTASIGTKAYYKVALAREDRDDDTKRWIGNPYGYLYGISDCFEDAEYYIKTVKGRTYLYMDLDGEPADRYHLDGKELAQLFFGV